MFNYNKFDRFAIRKCAPFIKNRKCIFPVRKGFKIHPHPDWFSLQPVRTIGRHN